MITIRLATIEDLNQIVDLRMAFLREMEPDSVDSEAETLRLTSQYVEDKLPKGEFLAWFAECDEKIVGTSGLVFFHRPPTLSNPSDLHAYVMNMYTLPDYRGKGIATIMLQHIIDHVKTTPAKRIFLHASEMGRPVYERLGFVSSDEAMTLTL